MVTTWENPDDGLSNSATAVQAGSNRIECGSVIFRTLTQRGSLSRCIHTKRQQENGEGRSKNFLFLLSPFSCSSRRRYRSGEVKVADMRATGAAAECHARPLSFSMRRCQVEPRAPSRCEW